MTGETPTCRAAGGDGCGCSYEPYDMGCYTAKRWLCERDVTGETPSPWLQDPDVTLYHGDCLEVLRTLPDRSVHMVATSPPFYGLRDYGTREWGWIECPVCDGKPGNETCDQCVGAGGWDGLLDRQIGLEETPDQWVDRLVAVFRECRRVLRDDGTLWVEIGDSYEANVRTGNGLGVSAKQASNTGTSPFVNQPRRPRSTKHKDLLGQPWLLAFALRADGWYLRSEIIWARPNPMPESVTDRPTKSHSTVFLLSKQPRYFYDADAIREPHQHDGRTVTTVVGKENSEQHRNGERWPGSGANARSVWTIPTEPTPFAHFATWPQALVRRMILAGTSEKGCCPECGAPWERVIASTGEVNERDRSNIVDYFPEKGGNPSGIRTLSGATYKPQRAATGEWRPTCECTTTTAGAPGANGAPPNTSLAQHSPGSAVGAAEEPLSPVPCTVLDPFAGSATTMLVARNHGRHSIGIELNENYLEIAGQRLQQLSLLA